MTLKEILDKKPCFACKHFESCKVRTGAYLPCKDKNHDNFEYNPNYKED